MSGRWGRLAPVTAIVSVALIVAAFIVGGEPPDADAPVAEVVSYYEANDTDVGVGSVLLALGAAFFAFFAAMLVGKLGRAEAQSYALPAGVLAGGVLVSTGILIFAGIGFTLADLADDLEPAAVQALHALSEDMFLPVAAGTVVLSWSLALAILRHGGLPRWLGWVALVIAIASVTPAGFFAFLALGVWALLASAVMLAQPESNAGPTTPGATTP